MRESPIISKRVEINGIVQGVGFRPFVYQLASRYHIRGDIANTSSGVSVRVEGPPGNIESFCKDMTQNPPPLAHITEIAVYPEAVKGFKDFAIIKSKHQAGKSTLISPDVSVCADCLHELFDPQDRRYRYPFINCTNCGPRYTIISDIPYDRPKTSMKHFKMCENCQSEYDNPENRRFHAQPNACEVCGPRVRLYDKTKTEIQDSNPIETTAELLKQGYIIAIKGLGGFHLATDAENDSAVIRLRKRKGREEKPFALMSRDIARICTFAHVDPEEEHLLLSPQRPIVLLKKKIPNALPDSVAPRNQYFGVMLPYTPLHYLLLNFLSNPASGTAALVMTSGNMSEEPIAIDNDEAFQRLSSIADYFLIHNRDIYLRSDDSIVRNLKLDPQNPATSNQQPASNIQHPASSIRQPASGIRQPASSIQHQFFRRSRGYVPVPVFLKRKMPQILACGAELKNTVCLTKGNNAFLSQHIGDMENLPTFEFFKLTIDHMQRILDIRPEIIAHDLHPDYLSTRYAMEQADIQKVAVQHHHAHIASCMAEHQLEEPVIGLSFDGTGYGTDGNIWGGEVLIVNDTGTFTRAAHLSYIPMPGSAAAIKEPWRMAISYLYETFGDGLWNLHLPILKELDENRAKIIVDMVKKKINSPYTSSLGRLFDGIAAIIGIRNRVCFEGQAAMELEMVAGRRAQVAGRRAQVYDYEWVSEGDGYRILLPPLIHGVVKDIQNGAELSEISGKFHMTIVQIFSELCEVLRRENGLNKVVLSGGVFQNAILLSGLIYSLERKKFQVFTNNSVPTNDGGIALGQSAVAATM
jgi:hydrogenase maturation protein HypF